MAQASLISTYDQFRFDLYLIKSAGDFSKNPVIANTGNMHLALEFAEFYTAKHGGQICINDLKTDQIKYIGIFKPAEIPAWQPKEPKVVSIAAPVETKTKKSEPVAAPVIESHNPTSKRDVAIALLKVIRDSKPLPARKVAEKAGLQYDIMVKRTLKELKELGKIVFDNGRWRKP